MAVVPMHRPRASSLLLSVLLACQLIYVIQAGKKTPEAALLDWAASKGAKVASVTVGSTRDGHRGLFAKKNIKAGDVVVSVPLSLAMHLGFVNETGPELATTLLREKFRSPQHYAAYLDALPEQMSVLCAEFIPDVLIPLLRRHELEELVKAKLSWFNKVMSGQAEGLRLPLREAIPMEAEVTEDDFKWATCMATSRSLATPSGNMYLIPVIDMANHAPEANCEPRIIAESDPQKMELVALEDVKAGDEVTISYGPLRNDEALLFYGFSMMGDQAYKQLCAVDTANYHPELQPGKHAYQQYGTDDDPAAIRHELDRLQKRMDYYYDRAERDSEDHYAAVQRCKDPDWEPHGTLEPEEEEEASVVMHRKERAELCGKLVSRLDVMVQVCDASLEWEVYRLQQLLSPSGVDIMAGEGDPDSDAEL